MGDLTPFASVAGLFEKFEHSAWRLETRRGYASDRGSDKWSRWQRGENIGSDPDNSWRRNIRAQVAKGKRVERVRLVDDPPTEGQRFLLASAISNVRAGEDIRNMYRGEAERLGLPEFDFWLFDSRILVKFHFDQEDTTLGVEVTEEPRQVLTACQIREVAWHHAIPTDEFARRIPSSA
ncbi:DUF6879 family protein [Streptomyces sp. LE64]|uniref:DUF6879 family protein n=1 Tax=Streptomyces sp. LE64 TaxID=3448653 RepID=UPI00404266A6